MHYYLWGYQGSTDHTEEDRIRGSCRLLTHPPTLISSKPEQELYYGIGHLADISDTLTPACSGWGLTHRTDGAEPLRQAGIVPILWGWSGLGMSRTLARQLGKFQTLVVSDRQTLTALQTAGLSKKVRMGPDLSFLVERKTRPLHGAFRADTVGLCLSAEPHPKESLLYQSYQRLIRYLMTQTALHGVLIPYCVRKGRNDCLLHTVLEQRFRGWNRLLCREDGTCQELRGDLSLCRFVIGSAGAVAAWSCGTPALCIGASPRVIGLAQELFRNWEDTVVPISCLTDPEDLTRRFRKFLRREDRLRKDLEYAVPLRRQQALDWQWSF